VSRPLVLVRVWASLAMAYLALAYVLDASHLGFVLLAGGAPPWAIAGAATLVVLRLVVVVLGPGVLAAALAMAAQKMWLTLARRPPRRCPSTE
jgi:hypothetical protein